MIQRISYWQDGEQYYADDHGGAFAVLASENSKISTNEILINSSADNTITVNEITDAYYIIPICPENGPRFIPQSVETNTTDRLFHEIGHVYYGGKSQDHVIDYNNIIRKILGLRKRRYDENHNPTITTSNY